MATQTRRTARSTEGAAAARRPRAAKRPATPTGTAAPGAARLAEIHELVGAIPPGRVLTYGQLADWLGLRSGHRLVARAMRDCPPRLPWHRVLGKRDARRARVAVGGELAALQRRLLEAEGVRFDERGFVPLADYGWRIG